MLSVLQCDLLANCREALNFLQDYLGLYDYFDFENGQPYTIIPYCTVIRDPRVLQYRTNITMHTLKLVCHLKNKIHFLLIAHLDLAKILVFWNFELE